MIVQVCFLPYSLSMQWQGTQHVHITEQQDYDRSRDGRHEFRSGTVSTDDKGFADDQGHVFEHDELSSATEG